MKIFSRIFRDIFNSVSLMAIGGILAVSVVSVDILAALDGSFLYMLLVAVVFSVIVEVSEFLQSKKSLSAYIREYQPYDS